MFTIVYPIKVKEKNVRVEGLEPPCLSAPDPKSGTSTNFATPACIFLFNQKWSAKIYTFLDFKIFF